jgi:hypothetical protein
MDANLLQNEINTLSIVFRLFDLPWPLARFALPALWTAPHIYAALAEKERRMISLRTKDALASAKARGKQLGGLCDYGRELQQAAIERAKALALVLGELAGLLRQFPRYGGQFPQYRDHDDYFGHEAPAARRVGVQKALMLERGRPSRSRRLQDTSLREQRRGIHEQPANLQGRWWLSEATLKVSKNDQARCRERGVFHRLFWNSLYKSQTRSR